MLLFNEQLIVCGRGGGSTPLSDLYLMEVTLIIGERDHAPAYADSVNQRTHPPYPVHRRLRGPQNLSGRR